jgi:poly(A) polymerase
LLIKHHIWSQLFADVPQQVTPFIGLAAFNTDERIKQGKSINPAFFYAVLLWQAYLKRLQALQDKGLPDVEARTQAGMDVLRRQALRTAIPRYSENFIREVWELQPRLIEPRTRQIPALATHVRFRAAYDFLYLREQAGDEGTQGMGQWWHDYQDLSTDDKEKVIQKYNRQQIRDKRKRPAASTSESNDLNPVVDNSLDDYSDEVILSVTAKASTRPAARRQAARQQRQAKQPELASSIDNSLEHAVVASGKKVMDANHPITRRRRKPRDHFQVEMGRTP